VNEDKDQGLRDSQDYTNVISNDLTLNNYSLINFGEGVIDMENS